MRATLVALSLCAVACGTGGATTPTRKDAMATPSTTSPPLREALRRARAELATRAEVESLPGAAAVQAALVGAELGQDLDALDAFIAYELAPERGDGATRAAAYCAALPLTPADVWGLPYAVTTGASRRLIALGSSAAPCLVKLLEDPRPVRYLEGEASTMASDLGWAVRDLAAALAAAITGAPWDGRAGAAARAEARASLRARLAP